MSVFDGVDQDEDEALAKNQKLLQMLGGIVSAPADSSVNYKQYVKGYLEEKFGHR